MNKKFVLGLILVAPVALTALFLAGVGIYWYAVSYPIATVVIVAIGMFLFGVLLLAEATGAYHDGGVNEKPPTNAEGISDESQS